MRRSPKISIARLGGALFLLAGLVAAADPADAATRALLVGVSDYPAFPPDKQLKAPANDVRRMRAALLARGIGEADITVLADGVEGSAGLPTRAAILAGMERLAQQAGRGDLVIVYASGHGSRQPSRTSRKVDGLDQVFLPRDAGAPASGGTAPAPRNRFDNAIAGPDFGERLDAIRARGADVWFILDSCFSGSASRAVGDDVHEKKIELEDIGLSAATAMAPDKTTVLADLAPALPPDAGRLTAFYASQPNETAREVALPPTAPADKRVWGSIFTTALTDVLKRAPALSYRQTIVETGRVLRADAAFQARQTPSFEGDGLEGALPGAAAPGEAATWRVSEGVLHAGRIEGLEAGAVVALFPAAPQPGDKPSGHALVEEAEAVRARLSPLKPGCVPGAARCPTVPTSPAFKQAAYARLARPAPLAAFGIAAPRPWPGAGAADPTAQAAQADALAAALAGPLKDRARADEAAPALVPWMSAEGLRFMPPGLDPAEVEAGPLVALAPGAAPSAEDVARAVLRARQVALIQSLAATGSGGDLDVSVEVRRYGYDAGTRQCAFKATPTEVDAEALVERCDKVQVAVENRSTRPMLAAIFFLDDGWNLIARRPTCPVGLTVSDRLEPGRRLLFEVPYHPRAIVPGRAPTTTNGVFVVGVPFVAGETDLPSLCALAAFNDRAAQATRGDDTGSGLDDLLDGATRGGRLPLESASLSLAFWPIRQPVKP
ncbi:caspase family protein [Ancylobacter terrae]|uniref:caspase family protein n=1 Tax=Ancylobacter sp. sgz301288 TaxID=3342077 RepID=UPI00385E5F28